MTHLANFRAMPPRRDGARRVNLKWRSVSGSFILAGPSVAGLGAAHYWRVYYNRHSKLGALLFANDECQRFAIAEELRAANIAPHDAAITFHGLRN